MNFFRTLRASAASYDELKAVMLRRRAPVSDRVDLPPESELVAFVESLDDDQFHVLLVICGAFMAKARGWDVFNLPHPPGY
jgi:hypothetical protein